MVIIGAPAPVAPFKIPAKMKETTIIM
jgi:hypothetical protein